MGTTTTMVTVQEFLALPEVEGERIELIGGEVVSMGQAKFGHEWVKANLILILSGWILKNPSLVLLSETMVQLSDNDSPIPDISLISRSRKPTDMSGWFQGAPDVAIEVVSSEKASVLEKKIELYLAHGSKSVWIVFPEHQVVRIYDASGQARMFNRTQTLEDPSVLPGFSAPVSAIFEGL
ncbi:MAG TPA: Uma2 family endonuclease [Bryobacteraceae bacterium]|nr:Uma2 family endonuclease [Bryobacteraceae bacterium]